MKISPELLGALCKEGSITRSPDGLTVAWCTEGLPLSARVVGAGHDLPSNSFVLFLDDDSFAEVEEGAVVPVIRPVWRQDRAEREKNPERE